MCGACVNKKAHSLFNSVFEYEKHSNYCVYYCYFQEKWTVSQEKSKLAALQTSVEQERSLLTEHLSRERNELSRAKVKVHIFGQLRLAVRL